MTFPADASTLTIYIKSETILNCFMQQITWWSEVLQAFCLRSFKDFRINLLECMIVSPTPTTRNTPAVITFQFVYELLKKHNAQYVHSFQHSSCLRWGEKSAIMTFAFIDLLKLKFTIQERKKKTLNIINYDSFSIYIEHFCSFLIVLCQLSTFFFLHLRHVASSINTLSVVNTSTYHFFFFFSIEKLFWNIFLFVHPHYRHFKSYMIALDIPLFIISRTVFHFC